MKIVQKLFLSIMIALVLAITGCEEGITIGSESKNGTGDDQDSGFSFSDMYSRMNTMEKEIKSLTKVNQEQAELIEKLNLVQANSEQGLSERLAVIENNVGTISIGTLDEDVTALKNNIGSFSLNEVDSRIGTLEGRVGTFSSATLANRIGSIEGLVGTFSSAGLEGRIGNLENNVSILEGTTSSHESSINYLSELFDGVTRGSNTDGYDTITFSGVNIQIVNGQASTYTANGLGNLIVGYNERRSSGNSRTGSHNIIAGFEHNYSQYGGLVVGSHNTISGKYASVSGGYNNTASGLAASVGGGSSNTASASYVSISGEEIQVRYRAHISDKGWQGWVYDGATAGTTGQHRAVEAFMVELIQP